ncbi:hypothetical protein CMUS01_15749 [Colletotrichum musicola]|uniref:Lysine-specific metallo-endopeptidase domain-containing protein n=1 Tax=Colletotrichum musicola TaxID=2175873 RepID=A0A8H6MLW2_9PEZI|nr:hypothetical protein CMUS01_15749 [Colletotrichum musicola]
MKSALLVLLLAAQHALAAKWVIDRACGDDDYDAKFATIKGNFEEISQIPENVYPTVYLQENGWRFFGMKDPNNISHVGRLECPAAEEVPRGSAVCAYRDPNDNNLVNGEAVTARWETRIDKSKGYVDGNVREARRAASIDVCKFMRDMWNPKGWLALDAEFVEKTRLPSEEKAIIDAWKVAFPGKPFVHFEALVTMEHTILHELFHTKHGGRKLDKGRGNIDCYGFSCVAKIHEAKNADSLAYLGMMLQLLDWGFMVNDQGVVIKTGIIEE